MEHIASDVIVYSSTEYARFKMITGNRQLIEGKIKRIMADIDDGIDMLQYSPIQVVEHKGRLEIIDGQHRFFISKKLRRPVFYIIIKEERALVDIAKINSNTDKWSTRDYINCYVQQGIKDYQQLQEFIEKYQISSSVSMKLLQNGNPGVEGASKRMSTPFRRGDFQVKFLDKATAVAEACNLFSAFQYHRERGFVIAIYRIMESKKIRIEDMADRFAKSHEMLVRQGGYKEYLFNLEAVYNKGKQNRVIIY